MPLPGTAKAHSTLREVAAQFYVNPDWILARDRSRRVVAARREFIIRAHQRGVRIYVLAQVLNTWRSHICLHLYPDYRERVAAKDKTRQRAWKTSGLTRREYYRRKQTSSGA